jgi:serine/threonine-protein kinase
LLELGTTEILISKLTRAQGLSVQPYYRVRKFVSPDQDPVEAGRELGVDVVLVGSMQVTPNRDEVRVSLQLLRVADSQDLWVADPFDEVIRKSIFDVQDMISERVANELNATLTAYSKKNYTENVEAFRLYVNGRRTLATLNPADAPRAIDYFRRAIDLDQRYALAYTGVAEAYRTLVLSGEQRPSESIQPAIEAAKKA